MSQSNRASICVALLAFTAGFSPVASAYLDPSTGSMILSAIVGIFATVGLALKTYWYKVKAFFRGDKTIPEDPSASANQINQNELSAEQQSD